LEGCRERPGRRLGAATHSLSHLTGKTVYHCHILDHEDLGDDGRDRGQLVRFEGSHVQVARFGTVTNTGWCVGFHASRNEGRRPCQGSVFARTMG
jgi:hypothetical protein